MQASLFDQPLKKRVLTVSELAEGIRAAFAGEFTGIWVAGEISGTKLAPSGHAYFTLKDETAQIQCVCYRTSLRYLKCKPQDGLAVLARGRLDFYDARGATQFLVESIEPQGFGALQFAFEQLKTKLTAEGLFDLARKRKLPALPQRIGIVTSPSGAVISDVLQILERRFPGRHVRVYPALVQGEGSIEQVARGIEYFSRSGWAEVVIVARGGGSLEDLWTFNEEAVARAIAGCSVPVISAIGHETDFTIADFVADLRAPTPSAAAELVLPTRAAILDRFTGGEQRMTQLVRWQIATLGRTLEQLGLERASAALHRSINRRAQVVDDAEYRMREIVRANSDAGRRKLALLESRLRALDVRVRFAQAHRILDTSDAAMARLIRARIARGRARLGPLQAHVTQLSPLKILDRGYAIVTNEDGRIVKSPGDAPAGTKIRARVAAGSVDARVEDGLG
ncbi:MAG: exodeoxyribonuclease VII large subunit [Bryobacteraceae bacterium]